MNVFMNVLKKRLVRAKRIPAVRPSALSSAYVSEWRESDSALRAFADSVNQHRFERRGIGPFWALTARI